MEVRREERPPSVPSEAKQGGDKPKARDYGWVERAVWTDRMLAALEGGVKGGKWFSFRRWPNAFFGEHGLFSMASARMQLVQPPLG